MLFKTRRRLAGAALGAVLCLALPAAVSCGANSEDTGKPVVAVTIVPEKTFVKAVCGDLMDVVTLVPPGNSPENYEPTPDIMARLERASVYFAIGVPVEKAHILPRVGGVKVVSLQNEVAAVYPDRTFPSGERDHHIWLSPKRVKVMVAAIARELAAIDPENEKVYGENAAAYAARLDELDGQIKEALDGVKNRRFIAYHPAFGYLADDYGLSMYALEEEGKEATVRHLQDMIDFAKAESIKVVFYQEEIDSRQSEAFAEEIGGKTMRLEPLAADYIDNLKKMAEIMAEVMR